LIVTASWISTEVPLVYELFVSILITPNWTPTLPSIVQLLESVFEPVTCSEIWEVLPLQLLIGAPRIKLYVRDVVALLAVKEHFDLPQLQLAN